MRFDEARSGLYPCFARPDEKIPQVGFLGGITLGFLDGAGMEPVGWDAFNAWNVPRKTAAHAAWENAFADLTCDMWEPQVYKGDDTGGARLLDPAPYLEHNDVAGRHVFYAFTESSTPLMGAGVPAGLDRVRVAFVSLPLANAALVFDSYRNVWERFEMPNA